MAQCKWCEKKGMLLSVNWDGLCKVCASTVAIEIQQRTRIIDDSARLALEGKKIDTRLSRCNLVLEHANALLKYEEKGVPTIDPDPSKLIFGFNELHDKIIIEEMEGITNKALTKAGVATTNKQAINEATKALVKIKEWEDKLNEPGGLEDLEGQVRTFTHEKQLNGFLEEARKAEFKGNTKKALDQYQEALYFLKTDEVDDSLQAGAISEIEAKIKELSQS